MARLGKTEWPARRYVILGFAALVILVGGFGIWVARTNIAGAIVSSGKIEIEAKRHVIQYPERGQILAVLIKEGDVVAANDPLLQLDTSQIRAQFEVAEFQLHEITARLARLEAERDDTLEIVFPPQILALETVRANIARMLRDQRQLLTAHDALQKQVISGLQKKTVQIQLSIKGLEAHYSALSTQNRIVLHQLDDQQNLYDRGLVPSAALTALQREAAKLQGSMGSLTAQIAADRERITENEIEIAKTFTMQRERAIARIRDLEYRQNELVVKVDELKREISAHTIRAPIGGTVFDLRIVAPKTVISPGETLLSLVPTSRKFVVGARIAPSDVDELFVGQNAYVRFGSLSGVKSPEVPGHISHLSADALEDTQNRGSYFRARVEISASALEPFKTAISPGMPVEVFFRTTDQPAWVYLSKPLHVYFARAFREN